MIHHTNFNHIVLCVIIIILFIQEGYSQTSALTEFSNEECSINQSIGHQLAYKLINARQFELAKEKIDELSTLWPNNYWTRYLRGVYFAERRNWAEAAKEYGKAIECDPESAIAYYTRANALIKLKKYADAISDLNIIVSAHYKTESALEMRAFALHKIEKYSDAISDYSRLLSSEFNLSNDYTAQYLYNRAAIYMRRSQFDEALSDLNQAIAYDNNFAQYYQVRAILLSNFYQNFSAAADDYEKTLELEPKSQIALFELSLLYAACDDEKVRNPMKALNYARKLQEMQNSEDPNDRLKKRTIYELFAAIYAEKGRFDIAVQYQKEAIEYIKKEKVNDKSSNLDSVLNNLERALHLYNQGKPLRLYFHSGLRDILD